MIDPDFKALDQELAKSRLEILQLAERVKNLVAKRNEREALVEKLRRTAALPRPLHSTREDRELHHLCSLCAADHASHVEHVRGCAPGSRCDQCGQPAIMWVQLREDVAVRAFSKKSV